MSGITRYIFRQLAVGTILVSIVLALVVWLTQSLQFLQFVINKGLAINAWLKLTLLLLPWFLSVILPATLFLVTLFVYNKLTIDRELVVAQAAGISRLGLARPALLSAAVAVAAGYILTLVVVPNAFQSFRTLQWTIRSDVSQFMLRAGAFNNLTKGLTVYVRSRGRDGGLLGVLIHDTRAPESSLTIMAERGAVGRSDTGSRVLLFNGSRQSLVPQTGELSVLYFDSYALDFGTLQSVPENRYESNRERSTWELLTAAEREGLSARVAVRMRAEGHQRLVEPLNSLGFACVALTFLLTGAFSRRGQTGRIVMAIFAIILLQSAALGAANLAGKEALFTPLMYVVALLPIAIGLYIIARGGRSSPARRTLPLGASTA
ncbi:MAG: LPS export ABC transporter permease LptF [Rhodospirillaceae bacterium]|nr:LPS export ABC transporter permease LptF [Rhodospirillaceae bacterium]